MHEVPKDALEKTFREFLDRSDSQIAVPRGGLPYLRRLSADALGGERARAVFRTHPAKTSVIPTVTTASGTRTATLLAASAELSPGWIMRLRMHPVPSIAVIATVKSLFIASPLVWSTKRSLLRSHAL